MLDVLTHGDYDAYWKQNGYNVEEYYAEHKDVPVHLLTGWYDSYCRSVTENFIALRRRKRWADRLIMGRWPHGVAPTGTAPARPTSAPSRSRLR